MDRIINKTNLEELVLNNKFGRIYRAYFPNSKSYIGLTKNTVDKRRKEHYNSIKRSKSIFPKALRKYEGQIEWQIIDWADSLEELNKKELYYIDKYRTYVKFHDAWGYNVTLGGESNERFTKYNDIDLKEIGTDIIKGLPKKVIKEKYGMNNKEYTEISRGKKWSYYTKIEPINPSIEEENTVITKYLVNKIISLFKELGDVKTISEEIGCSKAVVLKVVKGETWSKYTGITSNDFYLKYATTITKYKDKIVDILDLRKLGLTYRDISKKMGINETTIQNICKGKSLSMFTGITEENIEYKQGRILSENQIELVKNRLKNGEKAMNIAKDLLVSYLVIDRISLSCLTQEEKYNNFQKTNKLTLDLVDRIAQLTKLGISKDNILKDLGLPKELSTTVYNVMIGRTWGWRTGIKYISKKSPGRNGYTLKEEQVDEIIRLNNEGKTQVEINKITGISKNLIWNVVSGKTWSNYTGITYKIKYPKKKKDLNK